MLTHHFLRQSFSLLHAQMLIFFWVFKHKILIIFLSLHGSFCYYLLLIFKLSSVQSSFKLNLFIPSNNRSTIQRNQLIKSYPSVLVSPLEEVFKSVSPIVFTNCCNGLSEGNTSFAFSNRPFKFFDIFSKFTSYITVTIFTI